jgi:hypothetical protein
MAPEIDVPPPWSRRGVASTAAAKSSAEAASRTIVQPITWICIAGPVHCTMVTAIAWAAPERIAARTLGDRKASA